MVPEKREVVKVMICNKRFRRSSVFLISSLYVLQRMGNKGPNDFVAVSHQVSLSVSMALTLSLIHI